MKKLFLATLLISVLAGCDSDSYSSNDIFNDDLIIHDIPNISLSLESDEKSFTYYVIAESESGHELSFSLENNPEWITINRETGVIHVDLVSATAGEHQFSVVVTDGEVTKKQTITINISMFTADLDNASPVIAEIPAISARANHKATFQIIATDANPSDTLTYHLGSMPAFISIDPMTGLITIEAEETDVGSHPFTVSVSDGNTETTAYSSVEVSLSEAPLPDLVNNAPMVATIPTIVVNTGKTASQRIHARDIDDQVLTYRLSETSDWVQVDSHYGLITVTPTTDNVGTHTFNVIVTDGIIDVSRSFEVQVSTSPEAPDVNYPPQVEMIPTLPIQASTTETYRVHAADGNNDELAYSLIGGEPWASIDSKTGMLTFTPNNDHINTHDLTVTVTDGKSETSVSFQVIVVAYSGILDPVEYALKTGNHALATEDQLLEYTLNKLNDDVVNSGRIVQELYEGVNNLTWNPSHDSTYIRGYLSDNGNVQILKGNINAAGETSSVNFGIVGERENGHRYAYLTGNPLGVYGGTDGNADLDKLTKNLMEWLLKEDKSSLNIVTAQIPNAGYFPHYRKMVEWLNIYYPESFTINSHKECDYENLTTCLSENNPDLVILSSDDYLSQGENALKPAYDYINRNNIPVLLASYGREAQPINAPFLSDIGVFAVDNNYWQKYRIENGSVQDVIPAVDARSELIQKFINEDFDTSAMDACTIEVINCTGDAFVKEFRASADIFRSNVTAIDAKDVDVFQEDGYETTKLSLLLSDKYRSEIDYPITHSDPVHWYKALFSDWVVSYARDNNRAQPDLGEYITDTKNVIKSDNAHYTYPETVSASQVSSVPYPNQWTTTGWYALPGTPVTLTRTGDDTHEILVRLHYARSKTNRVHETKQFTKPVELTTTRLKVPVKGSVTFTTPYGAAIYLQHNGGMESQIEAKGIALHPTITDFNDSVQITTFENTLNNTELPHVDLKTFGAELHMRRDRFTGAIGETYPNTKALLKGINEDHLETVYSLAAFKVQGKTLEESVAPWAMEACKTKFGSEDCTDETLHVRAIIQHANYDQHAQCGIGCAGNPWDSGESVSPRGWLDNHELGHNLQTGRLRVGYVSEEQRNSWSNYADRAGENSNNIFPYYVRWKSWYITDGNTETIFDGHMNIKDIFYAYQSDVENLTNGSGQRVVYDSRCNITDTGVTRHEAIWSDNSYAHNNSYRMGFYIQMALRADRLNSVTSKNGKGFDIYPALYLHERIFSKYIEDEATWMENRNKLGFSMFAYETDHGNMKTISGNDFMLVSLSYLTGYDWLPHFELYGLRNSDLAKAQAAVHGIEGKLPTGMYVLEEDLPGENVSEDLTFLPLGDTLTGTTWSSDSSTPKLCATK